MFTTLISAISAMFTQILAWFTEASTNILENPLLLLPIVFIISFIVIRFVWSIIRNIQS